MQYSTWLQVIQHRLPYKTEVRLQQLLALAYKDSEDEFEAPGQRGLRIRPARLFRGLADWNFGLFVQASCGLAPAG